MKQYGSRIRSVLVGLIVIAAGVLLYLFNTGYLPFEYESIVFSWPTLLIAIGLICFLSGRKWFFGLLLMLVGTFFLLPKFNIEALSLITQNGWALLLVILGIVILYRAIRRRHGTEYYQARLRRKMDRQWENQAQRRERNHQRNGAGYIDRNYVFGGAKEKIDAPEFKGGEINCVFGGLELDLTDSQLSEGINVLEINTVFGGVVLFVPIHWRIEIRQSNVFGNLVDRRPKPGFEVDENRMLIIEVSTVFGGGEIKCKNE